MRIGAKVEDKSKADAVCRWRRRNGLIQLHSCLGSEVLWVRLQSWLLACERPHRLAGIDLVHCSNMRSKVPLFRVCNRASANKAKRGVKPHATVLWLDRDFSPLGASRSETSLSASSDEVGGGTC